MSLTINSLISYASLSRTEVKIAWIIFCLEKWSQGEKDNVGVRATVQEAWDPLLQGSSGGEKSARQEVNFSGA